MAPEAMKSYECAPLTIGGRGSPACIPHHSCRGIIQFADGEIRIVALYRIHPVAGIQ